MAATRVSIGSVSGYFFENKLQLKLGKNLKSLTKLYSKIKSLHSSLLLCIIWFLCVVLVCALKSYFLFCLSTDVS